MLPGCGGGGSGMWRTLPMDRALPGGATPPSRIPSPNQLQAFFPEPRATWTTEENRVFEAALVGLCGTAEDERFRCIAARIPGKSPEDVREHYRRLESDLMNIEAGIIELPEFPAAAGGGGKSKAEERKKGIPWTEEEHRRFLEGLEKYGKGDWRSISRNSVVTRTPTQVASHAQKYFLRQSVEGKKDRRRSSIHDVTRA